MKNFLWHSRVFVFILLILDFVFVFFFVLFPPAVYLVHCCCHFRLFSLRSIVQLKWSERRIKVVPLTTCNTQYSIRMCFYSIHLIPLWDFFFTVLFYFGYLFNLHHLASSQLVIQENNTSIKTRKIIVYGHLYKLHWICLLWHVSYWLTSIWRVERFMPTPSHFINSSKWSALHKSTWYL